MQAEENVTEQQMRKSNSERHALYGMCYGKYCKCSSKGRQTEAEYHHHGAVNPITHPNNDALVSYGVLAYYTGHKSE